MGLAAGQARLLSITARKSDCEFRSMSLSHQKISLARQLADLSNEYQNSLDQTKLIYDYYGTGDTNTPLSYGILMSPSALNDYMPTTITDSIGRVVLNNKYASAARAAGIPQEGLGTLPSEAMRNAFIQGLASKGVITNVLASTILGLPYNQEAGFGGGTTVSTIWEPGNITDLCEYLKNNGTSYSIDSNSLPKQDRKNAKDKDATSYVDLGIKDANGFDVTRDHNKTLTANFTVADLLQGSNQYYLSYEGVKGEQSPVYGIALMQDFLNGGFIDWIANEFSAVLDLGDGFTSKALEYAKSQTTNLLYKKDIIDGCDEKSGHDYWVKRSDGKDTDDNTQYLTKISFENGELKLTDNSVKQYLDPIGTNVQTKGSQDEKYQSWVVSESENYIGFTFIGSRKGGGDDGNDHATAGLNLNNIAKAFLTYFADYMNGVSQTDIYGNDLYNVKIGRKESSNLITEDYLYKFKIKTGTKVSSDDLAQSTFYDALFNQICKNGWSENEKISDSSYLQQMLQNGMLFISKMKDDGYYYQGNYATDPYIKEISDETAIAQAESKYTTEKAKLNTKEETLDLKMKNLDTEISSLTTEYDTVKNTISKNIEKSFKRYSA